MGRGLVVGVATRAQWLPSAPAGGHRLTVASAPASAFSPPDPVSVLLPNPAGTRGKRAEDRRERVLKEEGPLLGLWGAPLGQHSHAGRAGAPESSGASGSVGRSASI